ncbi:MAG: ribosome maturation factor RimM [Treponema sp.]|nr:ribosome maturation factor RimM [Treponema sp.]
MTKQFVAGVVGAPFGLKGFVKVKSLSGETDHLLRLKSVTLRKDGKEWAINIEESSAVPPAMVMRFAGFNSPEEARKLTGAELLVNREDAAPLQPGEFYVEDLKGLMVVSGSSDPDGEGEALGQIVSVIDAGGGDLAEIRLQDGKTRLVPFREEFFSDVDLEQGRVVLRNAWVLE